MEKLGFIGLGIMGKPMAGHLCKAGRDLRVYDLDQGRVDMLTAQGAKAAGAEEIAKECDVIFTILPTGKIVQDMLFGESGIAKFLKKGAVVIDSSSVTPGESRYCREKLAGIGVDFLDAPVSGGEPKAIDGSLAFMVGGAKAAFERVYPYFMDMGSSAVLVGDSGAGSITKLVNQIIVNMNIAVLGEAFTFAAKAGVDPEKVYEAIRGGLAGSTTMDAKVPMMMDRNFKPGGTIKVNHKDLTNVLSAAHEMEIPVPFSAQLYEIMQTLKAGGHLEEDHSAYVKYFEMLAGTEVRRGGVK